MNKNLVALSALALLAVPAVSAAPLPSVPDTLAQSAGSGLVSIAYTLDPDVVPGDVLALCPESADVPQNHTLVGTVLDDCFQVYSYTASSLLGLCDPVIVAPNPGHVPPFFLNPDEYCIENLPWAVVNFVLGLISSEKIPVNISIQTGT